MLTPEQLIEVQADGRFDAVLDGDEILDALEAEKYNRFDEFAALTAVLGGRFSISGSSVDFEPITPAVWSILWMIENAFATGEHPSELDADLLLYLLHTGLDELPDLAVLPDIASGFCRRNGIDPDDAVYSSKQMIAVAFRPAEMLSACRSAGEEVRFDADWLTGIASVVCRETNFDADHVIFKLPLASCFYYCVQAARRHDTKHCIRRRSSSELSKEIYQRTMTLAEKFYREVLHHADGCKTDAR